MAKSNRWLVWRYQLREGAWQKPPLKVADLQLADKTNPAHWSTFFAAVDAVDAGKVDGIGFALADSEWFGIDLDDCRDPATGDVEPWATKIVGTIGSYCEVSPSGTGLKLIARGKLPEGRRIKKLADGGQIELHEKAYFCMTGQVYGDCREINDGTEAVAKLHADLFAAPPAPKAKPHEKNGFHFKADDRGRLIERARKYVGKMPAAVSGSGGHIATFAVAVALRDFRLTQEEAWPILCEYSDRCLPPWSERELRHKLEDAFKSPINADRFEDRPGHGPKPSANGTAHERHDDDDGDSPAIFANFYEEEMTAGDRPVKIKCGYSAQHLGDQLRSMTGGWPKRVGRLLFARDGDAPHYLLILA